MNIGIDILSERLGSCDFVQVCGRSAESTLESTCLLHTRGRRVCVAYAACLGAAGRKKIPPTRLPGGACVPDESVVAS